jgi:hypothetical protein
MAAQQRRRIDGRTAARPYRLGNVPIIIGKWYKETIT